MYESEQNSEVYPVVFGLSSPCDISEETKVKTYLAKLASIAFLRCPKFKKFTPQLMII